MTVDLPRVCDPETFLAADPAERRRWVAKQIQTYPEYHDQYLWFSPGLAGERAEHLLSPRGCETTACVAGWAVLLAGHRPASCYTVRGRAGHKVSVKRLAARLLGFGSVRWDEPVEMFRADTTRARVLELLEE